MGGMLSELFTPREVMSPRDHVTASRVFDVCVRKQAGARPFPPYLVVAERLPSAVVMHACMQGGPPAGCR